MIVIIGAILSILLPGLVRSRQAAYRITCLNNLKQLGVAVETYVQTYGFYPLCVPWEVAEERWSDFLADKTIAIGKELGVPVSLWPFHQTAALYNCPVLSKADCDISYCYNWLAGAKYYRIEIAAAVPSYIPPPEEYELDYHLLRPQDVKSPAMFVLLYDLPVKSAQAATNPDDYDPYEDIDPDDYESIYNTPNRQGFICDSNTVFGPHNEGDDILFADGHVKWHKRWSDSSMGRDPSK